MNNKGSIFFGVIVALMLFVGGMLFANHVKDLITEDRNSNNLDCNNLSISDGTKLTCLGLDLVIPYLIIIILSAVGGAIMSKVV